MRELVLEQTFNTPLINLNGTGKLSILGKSIPENTLEFYMPVFEWIEGYGHYPAQKTTLDVNLEFFNSSSSKCLLTVLKGLEKIKKQGFDVSVNWYYNDDDEEMFDSGKDFADILNLSFNFIKT